jgi:hypothetical protein
MNRTVREEKIEVEGVSFAVKVYRESRPASRVSVSGQNIIVRLPGSLNREELVWEEARLRALAIKKIVENIDRFKPVPRKKYRNNSFLRIGGKEYILRLSYRPGRTSRARLDGNTVVMEISSRLKSVRKHEVIARLLGRLIGNERLPVLRMKIAELNEKYFQKTVNKISFKNNRSRWGSCTARGNISISTRLIAAPEEVLEYVCVHELAHLVEMNHSDRFWALVSKAMPDYMNSEKWLKNNQNTCGF